MSWSDDKRAIIRSGRHKLKLSKKKKKSKIFYHQITNLRFDLYLHQKLKKQSLKIDIICLKLSLNKNKKVRPKIIPIKIQTPIVYIMPASGINFLL